MTIGYLLVSLAAAALLFPLLLQQYFERLPEAPACPTCHGITRQADENRMKQMLSTFSATGVRACSRCGWQGRMRWRWAARHARNGS